MNTTGSRQRYNFERYDKVLSRGGYQAFGAPWLMPTYNKINLSFVCYRYNIWVGEGGKGDMSWCINKN